MHGHERAHIPTHMNIQPYTATPDDIQHHTHDHSQRELTNTHGHMIHDNMAPRTLHFSTPCNTMNTNDTDTHMAYAHEAEVNAEQTMHDALAQSDSMLLPMEIMNEIHNKSDTDLRLTIGRKENEGTKSRGKKRNERHEDERRPARRTRNTLRWDERAHTKYVDTYSNTMDIT